MAIIGASRNPRSFSAIMAERLRRDRADVALHLINPGAAAIPGASAVASLAEVSGEVDVALVVLPAVGSLAALCDCVDQGIPAVVLFAALQDGYAGFNNEVRRIIQGSRTRVLGPNCLGSANLYNGTSLTYGYLPGQPDGPGDAALAVIGHSGAVLQGIAMSAAELGCGVGYLVSLGNESDLAVVDFVAYFTDRPEIKVIVAYLEQLATRAGSSPWRRRHGGWARNWSCCAPARQTPAANSRPRTRARSSVKSSTKPRSWLSSVSTW